MITFLTLIVIPILLILFILNNMYSRTLIRNSADIQAEVLGRISTSIDNEMRQRALAALNIGVNYELLTLADRWHRELSGPLRYTIDMEMRSEISQPMLFMNEYQTIAIYFNNSDRVYSFGPVPAIPADEARGTQWHQRALRNPGRLIIDPSIRESGRRAVVTYAINPGAVVHRNDVEVVYFSFYVDFIHDYGLDRGDTVIVCGDGVIIFSTEPERLGLSLRDFPEMQISPSQLSSVQTIDGERVLVTTATVPRTGWQIIRLDPYSEITQQVSGVTVYGYIAISVYLILFILFSIIFYQKIFKSVVKLEIQALQYQITPHFIINTLNSIKIMAIISKQENIVKITEAFMRLLSSALGKTTTLTSIKEEVENIQNYIHVMKIRFGDKFEAEYEIGEDIRELSMLSFLLQPIVENAILHGFNEKDFGGLIRIKGYRRNNQVIFEVWDNGAGMTDDTVKRLLQEKSGRGKGFLSMGVYNVNKRIKLNYGKEYGLRIESAPGEYTRVILELPALAPAKEG